MSSSTSLRRIAQLTRAAALACAFAALPPLASAQAAASAPVPTSIPDPVPLDDPAFTDAITEQFRSALPDEHVVVIAPQRLAIGNAGTNVNLARLWQSCRATPATCDQQAADFVAGATRTFVAFNKPPERSQVRIAVRSTAMADAYRANSRTTGLNLQVQPFVDGLVSTVVIDTPTAMRWASSHDLDALKLDPAGLVALARANTHAALQPLASGAQPAPHGKIGAIEDESAYTASRVLFPSDWAPMAKAQGGVLIIALPTPTTIFYISDDSPAAVAALRTFAHDRMLQATTPLGDVLLRWSPDGWKRVP